MPHIRTLLVGMCVFALLGSAVFASTSPSVVAVGDVLEGRSAHTATALADGRVLITGGVNDTGTLASAELFDPANGSFTAAGALTTPRRDHTATLLPDGDVLVTGGTDGTGPVDSAEIFQIATRQFVAIGPMSAARSEHSATLLPDGTVLIAGGDAQGTAELYQPATRAFTPLPGRLVSVRSGHAAGLLPDGRVILAGGTDQLGMTLDSAEIYDPLTQEFRALDYSMSAPRTGLASAMTAAGDLVLVGGDLAGSVELHRDAEGAFVPLPLLLGAPRGTATRLANGKVLVVGRDRSVVYDSGQLEAFEGDASLWRHDHSAVSLVPDGKVLVGYGIDAQGAYLSRASLFNPVGIETDRDDYSPGSLAFITGHGFLPGEIVELVVLHTNGELDLGADHEPWQVLAGPDSVIETSWHVCEDDCLGQLLELSAKGLTSGLTAKTTFLDGVADLEAWHNVAATWDGTITVSNSQYFEGDTIPFRFTDKNETAGTTHTVALKYDFSSGTTRFFDSLGSYNTTVSGIDPCAGVSSCTGVLTWPIPTDGTLPPGAQIAGVLTTYNVSALSFGAYTLASGVKSIVVTFTVAGSSGNKNVVIAYGQHLARQSEWGANNGAGGFSGATTRALASLDGGADKSVSVTKQADLALTKSDSPDPVCTGTNLTYTLNLTNNGPFQANSVTVTDNLPNNTSFVSCNATGGGVCGGSGNNRTVTYTTLGSGTSSTITLVTSVLASAGSSLSNSASVSLVSPADPVNGNNSPSASTTVNKPPAVTTNPSNRSVCEGGSVTFTAAASGTPSPTVQWQVDSGGGFANIPGATSTSLTFTAGAAQNGNKYQAVFSNLCSTATTTQAILTVVPTLCRPAAGPCDVAETCNNGACPADDFEHSNVVCRPSVSDCDKEEKCTGSSAGCPADGSEPDGTRCEDGRFCNGDDTCSGGTCTVHAGDPCAGADGDGDCTESCDEASRSCTAADPDGSACTDGSDCTRSDACVAGECVGSDPVMCTASDQCHEAGTCNPSTGRCSDPSAPNGTACDDGDACTQTDACQGGMCDGSDPVACSALDSCHDAGDCDPTSGVCSNPAKDDGARCDDGTFCNGDDTCSGGACTIHEGDPCDGADGDGDCTESCDEAGRSCTAADLDGSACTDGSDCTRSDACLAGVCVGSDPVTCTPSDQCHEAGTCNPSTGRCSDPNAPNGTACNDGDACTQSDACQGGMCQGSDPVTCAAPDQCHERGECNPTSGICSNPAKDDGARCDDGNHCTETDTCVAGACVGADPKQCTPSDQCHLAGVCDPQNGRCSDPPVQDGTGCNDDNACTQTDACLDGRCTGTNPKQCTALDQCHLIGECNRNTGICSNPPAPDGTGCSDGNACTQTDTCQSGTCGGGNPVQCVASDQCHVAGTCNPTTGVCSNPPKPNGTACSDGNSCTSFDTCQSGLCRGSRLPDRSACSDGNACTINDCCSSGVCSGIVRVCQAPDQCHTAGACDPSNGVCVYPPKPNGTTCNDSSLCTTGDQCTDGTCRGAPKVCNDNNPCTTDSCSASSGLCTYTNRTGSCDDGNACTINDACSYGSCKGAAVTCAAPDACHNAGICSPATGSCSYSNKADGTTCSDGNACTLGETCRAGACGGGTCTSGLLGSVDADTTVRQSTPYTNYNLVQEVEGGNSPTCQSLFKVKVTTTLGISSAKLRLTTIRAAGTSAGSIHQVPCTWTESTVNWSSKPILGTILETKGATAPGQQTDFDVSTIVKSAGTYCFGIDNAGGNAVFASKESTNAALRPALLLQTTCACGP